MTYKIHIGDRKALVVSAGDYKRFNAAKDTPEYGDVCSKLITKYSKKKKKK